MSTPLPDLEALDRAHLLHPITEFRTHEKKGPRVLVGGEGIRLVTRDGRRGIDGFSGLWTSALGHCHPDIVAAAKAWGGERLLDDWTIIVAERCA